VLSSFNSREHYDISARSPPGPKTVIIQMFEWNLDGIAVEYKYFTGPAGYGYVQGSMMTE
jgi:hypothetical protein